jgi:hypothetical protein
MFISDYHKVTCLIHSEISRHRAFAMWGDSLKRSACMNPLNRKDLSLSLDRVAMKISVLSEVMCRSVVYLPTFPSSGWKRIFF